MNQNSMIRMILNELRPSPRKADDDHDAARQADLDERATPVCRGCDSLDAVDAEPPEWPCRTWTLIQQTLTP